MKISSDIFHINYLLNRFQINGFTPKTGITNEKIMFFYFQGYDQSVLNKLIQICQIPPIIISSIST